MAGGRAAAHFGNQQAEAHGGRRVGCGRGAQERGCGRNRWKTLCGNMRAHGGSAPKARRRARPQFARPHPADDGDRTAHRHTNRRARRTVGELTRPSSAPPAEETFDFPHVEPDVARPRAAASCAAAADSAPDAVVRLDPGRRPRKSAWNRRARYLRVQPSEPSRRAFNPVCPSWTLALSVCASHVKGIFRRAFPSRTPSGRPSVSPTA